MVGSVELYDAHTVAVLKKVRKLFPECLPVGFFGGSRIRKNSAVYQQDVVEGAEAIASPGFHKYLS